MNDGTTKGAHRRAHRSSIRSGNGHFLEEDAIGALSRAGQRYLYTMAALNEAAAQMATEQMSANMEAARTLGQCHGFGEALQVHSQLLTSSSETCMRGLARWVDASNQFMSEPFTQTEK